MLYWILLFPLVVSLKPSKTNRHLLAEDSSELLQILPLSAKRFLYTVLSVECFRPYRRTIRFKGRHSMHMKGHS